LPNFEDGLLLTATTFFICVMLCCIDNLKLGIFYLLIVFMSHNTGFSQTPAIDSLKNELNNPKSDKLSILFGLCRRGESMSADSMMMFARKAKEISAHSNNFQNMLQSDIFIARSFLLKGMADSCLDICNEALMKLKGKEEIFDIYYQLEWYKITALTKLRKIKESINECYNLLEAAEKYNDPSAKVIALNNLGVNNNILGNRAESLEWFRKAYQAIGDTNLEKKFSLVFTNLAATYFNASKNDSGYFFLKKAITIARENQNLRTEADCYTMQGLVYTEQNKLDSAQQMLEKAVALQKQIGNVQFILVGLSALETFYTQQKNYPKAIESIRQAEEYSKKFHEPLGLFFYNDLANCYRLMNNYDAYGKAMDTLLILKDSLYQKTKAEDLAKLEAQYDVSSKEAFIAKQRLELLHKNIWIASAVLISILLLTAAFFTYGQIKRRQKIELNDAEEKERKRIAADLHDNIGAYASAISDSIDEIENKKLISDSSSLQNLKSNAAEIISSLRDTIWAFNKESVTLTGISDRVKLYIQKVQPAYSCIHIMVEENISYDKQLSPAQALHIFRIIQEAIHNAISHSGGDKVLVNIDGNEERINISIEDNGSGFDIVSMMEAGNGLRNMQVRAAEAGYVLNISNAAITGTVVRMISKNNKI
jgi:signal transduction histidine kinase